MACERNGAPQGFEFPLRHQCSNRLGCSYFTFLVSMKRQEQRR